MPGIDLWLWRVYYRDGEILNEYDENGNARGWASVDLERGVDKIILVPSRDDLSMHALVVPPTAKAPVVFRRRTITIKTNPDDDTPIPDVPAITCAGWEGAYIFLFHDGSFVLSDNRDAV